MGDVAISGSTVARVLACPGSYWLSKKVPDVERDYATEGTIAHKVAELYALGKRKEAAAVPGCTAEMLRAAADWVDLLSAYDLIDLDIERPLKADAGFFMVTGKPDACGVLADGRVFVADFKYGQGVRVEAQGNKQLLTYAALYQWRSGAADPVGAVITIHQPNIGGVSIWDASPEDVNALIGDVTEVGNMLATSKEASVPRAVGEHCRFCPASGMCPEQLAALKDVIAVEPLTPEQLAEAYALIPAARIAINRLEERMLESVKAGEQPGFKMVAGRGSRNWVDAEAAIAELESLGLPRDELVTESVASVAQAEKVAKAMGVKIPEALVVKSSGKPTVAPVTDKRPGISAGDEFNEV